MSFRFIISATLLGNTLEWYDFATFGFLIPIFAKLFFPFSDAWSSLLHTMIAFYMGTMMRPIGGAVFGYIGDRYGRRIALILSVSLMTIPVALISALPTYLQIGYAAPLILIMMRMLQGLAAGGEFPGAMTFLVESAPIRKRGFYGSFAFFGALVGIVIAGADFFLFSSDFDDSTFIQWGWRIVFIIGAILGLISFLMRRKLHETDVFRNMRESHEILRDPIKELFVKHKIGLLKLSGIVILKTIAFNLIIPFSIVHLTEIAGLPFRQALLLNVVRLCVLVLVIPLAGKLTEKIGSNRLAVISAWGFLIFSIPLYMLTHEPNLRIFGSIGLAILLGSYLASLPATIFTLFPSKVRFSGIGIGYNLTIGIFGSAAPIAALTAIHAYGNHMIPAYLLMGSAAIALLTLRKVHEHPLKTNH